MRSQNPTLFVYRLLWRTYLAGPNLEWPGTRFLGHLVPYVIWASLFMELVDCFDAPKVQTRFLDGIKLWTPIAHYDPCTEVQLYAEQCSWPLAVKN
jgi:hypothetical protein